MPPLPRLAPLRVRRTVGGRGKKLPAELICVRLQGPVAVSRDLRVRLQSMQYFLKVFARGPDGNIPAVLAGHIYFACWRDRSSVPGRSLGRSLLPASKQCIAVRIIFRRHDVSRFRVQRFLIEEEKAAVVLVQMFLVDGFDKTSDLIDPGKVRLHAARRGYKNTAHVAVLPGQYGGIVLVCDSCKYVLVIQQGPDVLFEFGDDLRVGEELFEFSFALPSQILAFARHFAIRTVAHQSDDEAKSALMGCLDCVVGDLEGFGIENSSFRLQAEIAAHGIAHGLRTYDARSHHLGGIERIVYLKV